MSHSHNGSEVDILLPVVLAIVTFIYEPGNEKINDYCRAAVAGDQLGLDGEPLTTETFSSRKECWDYYDDFREDIPTINNGVKYPRGQ
tara:strand:- start:25411 stop:25674 length:264 start_codon:yes stop_codon:yes gene_type:complete